MTSDAHPFFRETLDRYERPLIRYAHNLVGQLEDARDIVQDVFIKFSQCHASVDRERLAPWLFTVCRNRATDHLRKHHRMVVMETETLDLEEADVARPGAELEQRETKGVIKRLMRELPEKQREAIRLKFIAGLSYQEISDTMKTSVGNVGYLIHHGIQALRTQWLAQDNAEAAFESNNSLGAGCLHSAI
jgi:RNA polymerase sigma-70 factor (ECF subfamily)